MGSIDCTTRRRTTCLNVCSTRSPMVLQHGRTGASCTAKVVFAFVLNFSMRTSLACVWKDEAQAPLIAPLEGAQLVSKCCI